MANGIQLSTNFDLKSAIPLDDRFIVSNFNDLNNISNCYAGLIVYVTGQNKYYYYDTGNAWLPFAFGSSQSINISDVLYTTGNSYIIAQPGDDLLLKYQQAKSLNPNNISKSEINRSLLILNPGVYNLTGHWDINEEFVDIIGIGAIKKDVGCIPNVVITGSGSSPLDSGFIHVSANDVRIKGIYFSGNYDQFFYLGNALPKQVFEDCKGNSRSFIFQKDRFFNDPISIDGTFINCEGGDFSFTSPGSTAISNGTFIKCKAGSYSFINGSNSELNGIYKNCHGQNNCFGAGGLGGILNGTFENCTANDNSFGYGGFPDLLGKFKNCSANDNSFGFGGNILMTGTFENCSAGNYSFGMTQTTSSGATFINCTAESIAWQGYTKLLAKLYHCRLKSGSFGPVSGIGLLRNCIDGDNNIVDG